LQWPYGCCPTWSGGSPGQTDTGLDPFDKK
jgi:hypothetical protein